jgi:uncharacterized cupredoxin-like copper-binding protein
MSRMKVGLAGLVLVLTAVFAVWAGPASASSSATAKPVNINVSAGEFYFKLSKLSIPKPGTVKFTVTNKGQIAHDFVFQSLNKGTKLLQPHQKVVLTVTFKKAGSYYYLCTVPRHAQEGMAGTFTVK